MKFSRFRSLKTALAIRFVIAASLPLLVFGLGGAAYLHKKITEEFYLDLKSHAKSIRDEVGEFVDELQFDLLIAQDTMGILGDRPSDIDTFLQSLVSNADYFEAIYLLDQELHVQSIGVSSEFTDHRSQYLGLDFSGFQFFENNQDTDLSDIKWSDISPSPLSGKPVLMLVADTGGGPLIGVIPLDRLNPILQRRIRNSETMAFALVDRHGTTIAHSDKHLAMQRSNLLNRHPEIQQALNTRKDLPLKRHEDDELLESVYSVPTVGWVVHASIPQSTISAHIDSLFKSLFTAVIGATLMGGFLAFWMARRISRHLVAMSAGAKELAEQGTIGFEPAMNSYVEIDDVMMHLHQMAAAVLERETSLAASEEWHRTILRTALNAIWTVDLKGNLLEVNEVYSAMSGYSPSELKGMNIASLDALESEEDVLHHIQEIIRAGEAKFESQHRRKDGTVYDVEVSAKYLPAGGGRIVTMISDISERKAAEEALRDSEERWRTIIESEPQCVKLLDEHGNVVFMNPAGLQMIQATLNEVEGRDASELVMPDDRINFKEMVAGVFRGETRNLVFDMMGLKGRRLTLETVSVPLWESAEKSRVKLLIGITRDITEHRKLMDDYRRSAQLAALGMVAAGVAHEINNPIQGIINYAALIGNSPDRADRIADFSGRIVKEADRIAGITRDLLHYARDNQGGFKPVNILDPIKAAVALLYLNYKHSGVNVSLRLPDDPVVVNANPQWIQQVVINLLENAYDAVLARGLSAEGEAIRVDGYIFEAGEPPQFVLEVLDFGVGIPTALLGKVRDAFFTTKHESKGTGLGLSIVGDIVAKHQGALNIESEAGQFTRVTVSLPMLQ